MAISGIIYSLLHPNQLRNYYWQCSLIETRWASLVKQELQTTPDHLRSLPIFSEGQSLVFCVVFYMSLFVFLWFYLCPLHWLSFDLRFLITALVSSSYFCRYMLNFHYESFARWVVELTDTVNIWVIKNHEIIIW